VRNVINILGYRILVTEVPKLSAEIEGIDGDFQYASPDHRKDYFGIIRVDKSLDKRKKRLVVMHELFHALNDIFWDEAHK
jgi:Zn-dependent peptidase ImmA (M78 family)